MSIQNALNREINKGKLKTRTVNVKRTQMKTPTKQGARRRAILHLNFRGT